MYNEVIFFPSRPGYTDVHVKRRVLDYLLFMNSKVGKGVKRFAGHAFTKERGIVSCPEELVSVAGTI